MIYCTMVWTLGHNTLWILLINHVSFYRISQLLADILLLLLQSNRKRSFLSYNCKVLNVYKLKLRPILIAKLHFQLKITKFLFKEACLRPQY